MSSFFSQASFVMDPSVYRAGTLFVPKPTDGSGDLNVTRSNDTATRVGPDGYIEKVRTNLILQSNSFSDAAWVKLGAGTGTAPVLTANYTTDPFGGNNAWRFQCDLNGGTASGDRSWIYQTFAGSPSNGTLSIYVKLNSAGSVNLVFSDGAGDTQTVTSTTWVRLNIPSAAIGEFRLGLIGYNGTDTCDLSIAFSQVEAGDIATNYIPTTTAAVTVGPVANVPRLDYLGSSCPRLLLEPQRTNSFTYSEQFDNAAWTKQDATITANSAVSPSGYQDADLYTTITDLYDFARQTKAFTSGTAYTLSVFVKAGTSDKISLTFQSAAFGVAGANFNLTTLAITPVGTTTGKIDNYGNGWYRCSATAQATATSNASVGFASPESGAVSTLYLWGAQLEEGAYPTSYVNTLGASVTRGVDSCYKTGISSLIGQTEGVVFVEYDQSLIGQSATRRIFALSDGTTSNRITAYISSSNRIDFYVRNSGGDLFLGTSASPIGNTKGVHKIAAAYKNGDYAVYLDGVQIISGAGTAGTLPTCSRFDLGNQLGSNDLYEPMMQVLLFKTRLSNSELAKLTSL
jgi:hypothetical protein